MIHIVEKGIYWKDEKAAIIFNPVSVSKNKLGQSVFNTNFRYNFKDVYDKYRDYIIAVSKKRLLGDVQLVQIEEKKFVMNGFIYWDDQINLKATTKALIELHNLAEEYKIPIALSGSLGSKDPETIESLNKIIHSIFAECKSDVYVYQRKIKK